MVVENNGVPLLSGSITSVNTHAFPDIAFDSPRWLVNDSVSPTGTTLFLIAKQLDTEERILWSMEVADTGRLVLTTHRVADLTTGKHLLNEEASNRPVELVVHHHRANTRIEGPVYFRLGHTAAIPTVPVPAFEGTIPELLFYDRVLSPKEQSRISSYLAIKYGLTLNGSDYVDSDQDRVWPSRANAAFTHNVLAIARDSASMLDQRESTSSNEDGFLTLAHDTIVRWHHEHPTQLPDRHYLVAGDNGETRDWAQRAPAQPQFSARTWHLQRTGPSVVDSRLRLTAEMMLNEPERDDTYWLFVDRSGTGDFGPTNTEIIKASTLHAGATDFQVVWDVDGSGADRFRFAAGGPFIPVTWLDQPTCDPQTMGALRIRVPGAVAPAYCQLKGVGRDVDRTAMLETDTLTVLTDIEPGEYDLTIRDDSGYAMTDRIWIQSNDAPIIPVLSRYELTAESPLLLDATTPGTFVTYEWRLEEEVVATHAVLTVSRPGTYTCTAIVDGCPTRATTRVDTRVSEGGITVGVMPNPSLNGDVAIQISLPKAMEATLTIATMQGVLVRQRVLRGQDFHRLQDHLEGPGEYILSVRTADGQQHTRVIIL